MILLSFNIGYVYTVSHKKHVTTFSTITINNY